MVFSWNSISLLRNKNSLSLEFTSLVSFKLRQSETVSQVDVDVYLTFRFWDSLPDERGPGLFGASRRTLSIHTIFFSLRYFFSRSFFFLLTGDKILIRDRFRDRFYLCTYTSLGKIVDSDLLNLTIKLTTGVVRFQTVNSNLDHWVRILGWWNPTTPPL